MHQLHPDITFTIVNSFDIAFNLNGEVYSSEVTRIDNLYRVSPDDDILSEVFGEIVLLEANGAFSWKTLSPDHYKYGLAIANALEKYLSM